MVKFVVFLVLSSVIWQNGEICSVRSVISVIWQNGEILVLSSVIWQNGEIPSVI